MIQIKDLCKTYGSGADQVHAVDHINLNIAKGEIFGVIGFSGAGKSSLIRCINMLETPTSGSIVINGQDITRLKGKDLRNARKKIGMIFQHFNLLATATVYQNVAIALELNKVPKDEIQKKVAHLLKIVGLEDKTDFYPSQLSGGQKQRVAIARALANDIDVLLCDEATSALDPQTTEAILDLLLEINKTMNITIVLITHEMNVIRKICDHVAVIEKGRIIEQDTVLNIFTHPQHQTTKNFMSSVLEADIPPALTCCLSDHQPGTILKLTFVGSDANEPFLSRISKDHNVVPNILSGNIIQVKQDMLGCLVVELLGDAADVQAAITSLRNSNVSVEVLN